ncbi:hypothetical protein [Legionella erythra]|uniref:Uncharacterized protein n=1 Tax=Legionella erythra TaxID=448 RepID=A0A0W0TKJ9_LEGER|nr:hypothetical protein [Legionella erythra]KTC96118.1 hypothetical protein Lery_1910 [Legionella erythra]
MSELTKRINEWAAANKSIWLVENDGTTHHLNAAGNTVGIIDGKGSEYIEITDGKSTVLYNLNQIKLIKIS